MHEVIIRGSKNIVNTGVINGNFKSISNTINLNIDLIELSKKIMMNEREKETSLVNMTEAQSKLADAIDKFAQAELTRAEADKLRAKADENNSEANLNYSKIMLEDRVIIKQMMDKLK